MQAAEDLHESRGLKRKRLDSEASRDMTETGDESDWDEIYGLKAVDAKESDLAQALEASLEENEGKQSARDRQSTAIHRSSSASSPSAFVIEKGEGISEQGETVVVTAAAAAAEQVVNGHGNGGNRQAKQATVEDNYSSDDEYVPTMDLESALPIKTRESSLAENEQPEKEGEENGTSRAVRGASVETISDISIIPRPEKDSAFLAAAAAQKENPAAEWTWSSSDAESSDSDTSSDDSDSEDGYQMLDAATTAKLLMAGDDEDDEDGDKSKDKNGADRQPRTANEMKEEVIPKPDVTVTADMKITYLGTVDIMVENGILIKASTPGEYQVLEYGSVLCTEKREVIGAIADTLGRVDAPKYAVLFSSTQEIEDFGLNCGTKIYFVDEHSSFVFTQPLKNSKGTDASNVHDEEVGEDEIEFSDDEMEAEYKRMTKIAKRENKDLPKKSAFIKERSNKIINATGPGVTATKVKPRLVPNPFAALPEKSGDTVMFDAVDAQQPRRDGLRNDRFFPKQPKQPSGGLNYDDEDQEEEGYNKLQRPDDYGKLIEPPPKPPLHGGRGRRRGDMRRGDRERGRGGRGGGRGGFDSGNARGGRGGFGVATGGYPQQSGQRGNAHGFPDQHKTSRPPGQAPLPGGFVLPRGSPPLPQTSPPPLPQMSPPRPQGYPPLPPQPRVPQTYQFNGYTFQYGNAPTPNGYHGAFQQPRPPLLPGSSMATGAFVNPAFFQYPQQWNQAQPQQQPPPPPPSQQQQQHQQGMAAWYQHMQQGASAPYATSNPFVTNPAAQQQPPRQ